MSKPQKQYSLTGGSRAKHIICAAIPIFLLIFGFISDFFSVLSFGPVERYLKSFGQDPQIITSIPFASPRYKSLQETRVSQIRPQLNKESHLDFDLYMTNREGPDYKRKSGLGSLEAVITQEEHNPNIWVRATLFNAQGVEALKDGCTEKACKAFYNALNVDKKNILALCYLYDIRSSENWETVDELLKAKGKAKEAIEKKLSKIANELKDLSFRIKTIDTSLISSLENKDALLKLSPVLMSSIENKLINRIQRIENSKNKSKKVISIGYNYSYSTDQSLLYAESDAIALANDFSKRGYESDLLINHKATNSNILEHIYGASLTSSESDILIIYFSGHGLVNNHGSPCIVTYKENGNDTLSLDVLQDALKMHKGSVYLISDSCFTRNTDILRHNENIFFKPDATKVKALFLASPIGEKAIESDEFRSGLATHSLREYLNRNKEEDIDLVSMLAFMQERTRHLSRSMYNYEQSPFLKLQ